MGLAAGFPVVGLTFALLLGMVATRTRAKKAGAVGNDQFGDCFSNQFELPLLFYVLIALALPLRHVDYVMVLLSWVFVVTRFAHAGIFVTSNNLQRRGHGMVRRRVGAVRDVALLRVEHPVVDLRLSHTDKSP